MPRTKADRVAPESEHPVAPIVAKRRCRDVIFLIIFLLYWAGMAFVAQSAVASGDPKRLVTPTDYLGQYCGYVNATATTASDVSAKPYLYYIDPVSLSYGVCVKSCPTDSALTTTYSTVICLYTETPDASTPSTTIASRIAAGKCSAYTYKSTPILNRCIPVDAISATLISQSPSAGNTTVSTNSMLSNGRSTAMQIITDLFTTWPVIAVFLAISLVVCFVWLVLLQWFAGPFVWFVVFAANGILIGASVWLYYYWQAKLTAFNSGSSSSSSAGTTLNTQTTASQYEVTWSQVAFIVCCVIAALLVLITIAMIKRIRIAVQIIKEASLFFPMWIYAGIILLIIYFVAIMLYLFTPNGSVSISAGSLKITDPDMSNKLIWYHLFGCIWMFVFLSGINQITIAGAVASWYWSLDKKTRQHLPVLHSFGRVCRYHLGSVALGSLLIAIVELVRIILMFLQRRARQSGNRTFQAIVACLQCCAKCIELTMKFINKNAYIYIAIKGTAFFKSASAASSLLVRNALRLVAVDFVADFVLILSKLAVTAAAGFLCYLWLNYKSDMYANVNFPFITIIIVVVEAYMVATAFFSIFHMAIDTIFLSFLEDCETNDGSPEKPFYMSDNLRRIVGKTSTAPVADTRQNGKKVTEVNEF
nr:hypothetical protein HK105_008263 [Polyrhizophydium stewartii]